ncbi:MAG: hypothetical protein IKA61_02075 [Clostridia bacterium]|nr:hypothetical protein [Clostridia bacterium]
MKKRLFCYLICFILLLSASCTITVTNESEEESISSSEEESTSSSEEESISSSEEESTSSIEFDNLIKIEESPYYFVLDEEVRAEISAYKGSEWRYDCCYYGEIEGKHVFYATNSFGASASMYLGDFRIFGLGWPSLFVWDGNEFKYCSQHENSKMFSFEASKQIAIIHANHLWNSCSNNVYPYCRIADKSLIHELPSDELWRQISGDYIKLPDGKYRLNSSCSEQEPIFNGRLDVVTCEMGLLPGEFKETNSIVVTIENTVGYEDRFTFYGTVADVEEMFQITEDMWLDSYDGFNKTEEFSLEKAKTLKYCVPIKVSAPSELNVEICLVTDNLKNSAYVLVFNVNEQTGEKYISQVYEYQKTE